MTAPTSARRPSRAPMWTGILVGLGILGLLVLFVVVLPEDPIEDQATLPALVLPDELPGGYPAADDAASFAGGDLEEQGDAIAAQQQADRAHGDRVLPQVLGTPAVTRTYVAEGTQAVYVQAFRSAGGAFAPNTLPDPEKAGGQVSTEMTNIGDGACILTYGQAVSGQEAPVPAFSQCQVSDQTVTVQIGSAALTGKEIVAAADALLKDLQDQ